MKGLGGNKILGIAVGERGVLACELSRAGAGFRADRMAELPYPTGVTPDDPATFGPALREFLKTHRFGARRAVIGLPLKWAVVKTKEIPPASPATLAELLRMQAERDFAMDPSDLALEYVGSPDLAAAGTVLLVAVPRKRLDAVREAAEAAGLNVSAVTLSAAALGRQTGLLTGGEGAVLHVSSGAAELAVQHQGQPRVLRHLRAPVAVIEVAGASGAVGTAGTGGEVTEGMATPAGEPIREAIPVPPAAVALTVELRQVLSLMPQNGTAAQLNVWDGVGLGDAPDRWAEALGVSVREQSLSALGVDAAGNGGAPGTGTGRFAPAVALAMSGLAAEPVVPDLLHSRLAERKKSRVGKPLVWGVVVAVTVVVGIVAAVLDLSNQRRDVADMKARLAKLQPELKTAEASIARTTFAQRWSDQDPRFLGVLRDLTALSPGDGQVWASTLNVQDDGRVTLTGRGTSYGAVQNVLDRLHASRAFTDLKTGDIRPAGRNTNDMTFSVSFRFGAPAAATQPAITRGGPATQNVGGRRARR